MKLKKMTFLLLFVLSGMNCFAQIKVADCVIYVAKGNPPSVMRGAKDLQKHIFLATGNKLAIVSKAKTPMIALGSSPEAKKAGVDASGKKYETHIIRTVKGNLYIAGRDIPRDRQADKGGFSYGTLYGIYAFMNDVMDIAFLMPTDRGTYIPKLGKDWKIPALNKSYTPQFEYRGFPYIPRKTGEFLLWKIRNFSDGRGDAGSVIPNHGHAWFDLYPTPGTLYSRWNKDRAVTYKENPEFFTAARNGNRIYPKFNFALCISNPAVWKDVAQRCIKMRRGANVYYRRKFKYEMISLSPNDGSYCYCEKCRKLYVPITEKEVGPWKSFPRVMQSSTPMMLDYYRAATKEIAKTFKYMEATGLIYDRFMYAWGVKDKKMPPQFSAMMAPLHISYGPGRVYAPINDSWHKWLNDWDGAFTRKYYYGLDFWFSQSAGAPWPVFAKMRNETYPVLAKKGFNGTYLYGMDMLGVTAAHNYLQMQQAWNPHLDAEKVFDSYCTKAYGKGGKYVKEIYLLVEKNLTKFLTSLKGKMWYYMTPELMKEVYAGDWDKFTSLMEKAVKAPKDANQKWRLDHFVRNMRLFNYHLEKMGMIKVNKSSLLYLSDAEYIAWTPHRTIGKDYYTKGGKWEYFLPQPRRNAYAKSAQIPIESTKAAPFKAAKSKAWHYLATDILVKAVSDRITFRIEQTAKINPATKKPYLDGIPYFSVFTPDGNLYFSGIAAQNKVEFPAKKGVTYFMWICPSSDTNYGHRWRITSADSPYALGSRIHPAGLQITFPPGEKLYFFVPGNLKKFDVIAPGWGGLKVLDPSGKVVAQADDLGGYKVIPVRNEKGLKSGVYTLVCTKNFWGRLRFSREVPGFFITDPAHALRVTLDDRKVREHEKKGRF